MRRNETTACALLSFRAKREILLNFYSHSSLVGVRAEKVSSGVYPCRRSRNDNLVFFASFASLSCKICAACANFSMCQSQEGEFQPAPTSRYFFATFAFLAVNSRILIFYLCGPCALCGQIS